MLVDLVRMGRVHPTMILTQQASIVSGLDAYRALDERKERRMGESRVASRKN